MISNSFKNQFLILSTAISLTGCGRSTTAQTYAVDTDGNGSYSCSTEVSDPQSQVICNKLRDNVALTKPECEISDQEIKLMCLVKVMPPVAPTNGQCQSGYTLFSDNQCYSAEIASAVQAAQGQQVAEVKPVVPPPVGGSETTPPIQQAPPVTGGTAPFGGGANPFAFITGLFSSFFGIFGGGR